MDDRPPGAGPGWYDDPYRTGWVRWSDGTAWTTHAVAADEPRPDRIIEQEWDGRRGNDRRADAMDESRPAWDVSVPRDLQDKDYPIEARSLGRTLIRWRHQIAAWHHAHVSNGPTEAANNLIKRVKRAAFGFTSFRNYRIRALLYAGKPNWELLATITPR